jgi:hypothetical protein
MILADWASGCNAPNLAGSGFISDEYTMTKSPANQRDNFSSASSPLLRRFRYQNIRGATQS